MSQADALDFPADGANYRISFVVAGQGLTTALERRLRKAPRWGFFGLWVLISALPHLIQRTVPAAETMGAVGAAALGANAASFVLFMGLSRW